MQQIDNNQVYRRNRRAGVWSVRGVLPSALLPYVPVPMPATAVWICVMVMTSTQHTK